MVHKKDKWHKCPWQGKKKKKKISLCRCSFRVHTPDWNKNLFSFVLRTGSVVVKGSLNESQFYRLILIWELGQSSVQSCFSSLLHLKYDSLIANMCCVWVAGGNRSASEAQDKKKKPKQLACVYTWKKMLLLFFSFRSVGQLVLLMPYHSLKADSDICASRRKNFHLLKELVAGVRGHYNIFLWIMSWIITPIV